jgi:hypothetical protein
MLDGSHMLTRAAAISLVNECFSRSLKGAPFDVEALDLVADAGACSACPYRVGNNPDIYGDLDAPNTCMRQWHEPIPPFHRVEPSQTSRRAFASRANHPYNSGYYPAKSGKHLPPNIWLIQYRW